MGDGRKKDFVVKQINKFNLEKNFHLLGAFPVKDMADFFACADVLLVTLKKSKIFSLTIPYFISINLLKNKCIQLWIMAS